MTMLTGGCLCGAIRYAASADPLWLCHCHCEMCRRQTEFPLGTYVGFPAAAVVWLGREPHSLPIIRRLLAFGVLVQHVWFREHISWFDTVDDWPRYPAFPPGRDAELEELNGQAIAG